MVIISKEIIDTSLDFSRYSFELSIWQQNAIWGILNNKNVIGKTLHYEEGARFWRKPNKNLLIFLEKKNYNKVKKKNYI